MIKKEILQKVIFQTIKKGACNIPPDVEAAFRSSIISEETERAKEAFASTLKSLEESSIIFNPLCPDTGWPLFFCKIGNEAKIEGGIMQIEETAREMVAEATRAGYLRSTMKHPLTGYDPGTNIGTNVPGFSYKFVPGDSVQISYVAKGGGSECFGGTRYRVVAFADGLIGIEKTIIDWYIAATRAGAICPPSILGIGIGGTADIATHLAKEAATMRVVGSRHPEKEIADIEKDLKHAINSLDIGPMGAGGKNSVFAVNVEYSYTHLAGIAIAMSANCWVARRSTSIIYNNGNVLEIDNPEWFEGR